MGKSVIEAYYNCIVLRRMTLGEVPERYRKQVEIYYNQMEKKKVANQGFCGK